MRIEKGFPDTDRPVVAALYWEAFGRKLGRTLGPGERALKFLTPGLSPDHAFCARAMDGTVLGVAGFKTRHGALIRGGWREMARVYGPVGATWRMALLALLTTGEENRRFLIDGIFVAAGARGQGVGSRLIDALAQEAVARGYDEMRLEVVDNNPRAQALYERLGFVAIERQSIGLLRWIYGFRAATVMVRRLR